MNLQKSLFCMLLAASAGIAWGWSRDGEYPFGKLDDKWITPHIDFASEIPGRPLKVMVSAFGIGQREVIELKQRFHYEPLLMPVQNLSVFSPWTSGRPVAAGSTSMSQAEYDTWMDALMARLPECDAILIGKTRYELIPAKIRDRIMKRVHDGASLLWIAPFDKKMDIPGSTLKECSPDFPVDLIPALKGTKCYEGKYGKGKVVEVVYPMPKNELIHPYYKKIHESSYHEPLTPFESDDPLYYDFCHAFLGRCLWNLCRPDRVRIRSVQEGKVILDHVPEKGSRIAVQVFDSNGKTVSDFAVPAERETQVSLPESLPHNAEMVLYRLLSKDGKTVDYLPEDRKPDGNVFFEKLSFVRDGWKPGEIMEGTVSVHGGKPDDQILLKMTDENGRMIYRESLKWNAPEMPLKIRLNHWKSRFALAEAELNRGDRILDRTYCKLYFNTVEQDREDDFCFSIWSAHQVNSRVSKLALKRMRSAGIDNVMEITMGGTSYLRKFEIPRWIKEAGMNYSTYLTYLRGPSGKAAHSADCKQFSRYPDYLRTGVFPREGNKDYFRNPTREMDIVAGAKDIGVYFYNLGDENCLAVNLQDENCFCGECQKRFRNFLKKKYGSPEALNKEYKTSYESWEEVQALPFVQACKQGKTSLWMDFRAFMEEQFVDLHLYKAAQIKTIDPDAVCGIEGMGPPANSMCGFNLYKMLPHFGFCAPYFTSREMHALKYLGGKSPVKAAWYGTYSGQMLPGIVRRTPWRYLFYGLNGAFWWTAGANQSSPGFSNATIFRPDLGYLQQFELSAKEIRTIRESGAGKMIIHAKPYPNGIAVHYSNPCLHASTLNPGNTSWELSIQEFSAMLEENGLTYEFLSPPELEKGISPRIRVLILPFSQALSDRECEAITTFVRAGGLLIADYMPGQMNEHGTFRKKSPISDLFHTEKMKMKQTGEGFSLLTGDYLRDITSRIAMGSSSGVLRGMRHILKTAGVEPVVNVVNENGSIQRADVFQLGDLILLGMLGPLNDRIQVAEDAGLESAQKTVDQIGGSSVRKIILSKPYYAYDLSEGGICLGRSKEFELQIEDSVGRVIVFSEKELSSPTVFCSPSSIRPGEILKIRIGNPAGCSTLRFRSPSGKTTASLRTLGTEEEYVPAWNDEKGTWTVELKSALGGFVQTCNFELK